MNGGFYITKDDITTKTQFIAALRRFLLTGETTVMPDNGRKYRASLDETLIVEAIADYYEAHTEIPDKDTGINLFQDLRKHLADAFFEFRYHPKHAKLRQQYSEATNGDAIPDLFDLRGAAARSRVVFSLGRLMPLIAGRMGGVWLEHELVKYFDAQIHIVDAAWRVFVRDCYRAIAPVIKASSSRVHKGLFGRTTLSTYTLAGRAQYTFERPTSEPEHQSLYEKITAIVDTPGAAAEDKYAAIEAVLMTRTPAKRTYGAYEITFAADEGDMLGVRSGMNYPGSALTDYQACVEMIEDVVAHWNLAKLVEVDE